ncbi:MAG: dihydrofolate reductase family protein [Solirubrobacterales bacterium]
MAKLLYTATCSLDGFIAGPGGDMQWMNSVPGGNEAGGELMPRIGALLVGHNTWGGDDPNRGTEKEGAFGGAWSGPQFVLAHEPPADPPADVHFRDDLERAVAESREAAGERYVCVLGADVARQCLEAGELDEVLMCVAPVMLGDGVRIFQHPGGTEAMLERVSVSAEPGATNLWFRVL